jgi:hypothetical protein
VRVTFPAETTREYRFLGPLSGRTLLWLGAGAYAAAQPYSDATLPHLWRDVSAVACLGAGAACAFVQKDGVYLPTWIVRLVRYLLRPRRFLLR